MMMMMMMVVMMMMMMMMMNSERINHMSYVAEHKLQRKAFFHANNG